LNKTTRTNARQGTRPEIHNAVLTDWIKARSKGAELLLSVCTGARLLAIAGLLDGLEVTTHHGTIDLLRQVAPMTTVHADPPPVVSMTPRSAEVARKVAAMIEPYLPGVGR
jgi:transcriptional regulator GlxA family with amidase domain